MSKSLLDQLEVYGTDFETALAPTEVDDVVTYRREIGFTPKAPSRPHPRLGWATAAAAVVMVIVLVGGVAWLLSGNAEQEVAQTTVTTPSVTTVPAVPVTPEATDVIAVGGWPRHLVAADGAIWVALQFQSSVIRIDATTLQVTDTIPVGVAPLHMFPTEDGLWVLDNDGGGLLLVDTSTRQVTDSIEILDRGGQEISPVLVGETLWVFTNTSGPPTMVEVDLAERAVVSETPVGHLPWWAEAINGAIWSWAPTDGLRRFDLETRERDVFVDAYLDYTEECCIALDDAIWLVSHNEPLLRFSLRTQEVTDKLDLQVGAAGPGRPVGRGIAAAGAIWIPNRDSRTIYRIDPTLRSVTDEIRVGLEPTTPVFADGAIWVPNQGDGTVSRIDIETREVTDTIQVGNRPMTPWALNGAIWVPNFEDGTVTRIQTR